MSDDMEAIALQAFLDDRISEDEAEARREKFANDSRHPLDYCHECGGSSSGLVGSFDPERALAEAEVKRHMIDEALIHGEAWRDHISRYLALAYADHDDYREGWRP